MKEKKPELLAPSGNLKKLKVALAFGADAVYCGLPGFSLRAKTGFSVSDLKKGIEYAHGQNKKVYITINIFARNSHIKKLPRYLKFLKKIQPDAVILSDPGVLNLVKKYLPKIPIHLSTQANTLNYEAVKFWQSQGVKRIILGREATLKDIKAIKKAAPKMELEVFVHGAMCMSYSGRCYLSAWLNKRSANEGLCTQPCRWDYRVYLEENLRPGEYIPIEADDQGTYIMNSRDLCLIDYLNDLKKAGVDSFKIEGRTKSIYYLAVVIRAYNKGIKSELFKTDNRGYTTGFLFGEDKNIQNFESSKATSNWEFVGEVVRFKIADCQLPIVYIKVHNVLKSGDEVEIVTPDKVYKTKIKQLYDKDGKKVKQAHGGTGKLFYFEVDKDYDKIVVMSLLRKHK